MAKEYLCKDCINNNNGWCRKRKFNGLKKITECEFKTTKVDEIEETKEVDTEQYKQFGKREMFYNIQMQLITINQQCNTYEDKWKATVEVINSLGQMLDANENIFGIATEYLIDQDIVNNSKEINNNWLELMK